MAEEPTELRRVNWSECFAFTHIFRTFRMAIHPSKLGLALAAILLTILWGGFLDLIWRAKCQPLKGEVNAFWQVPDIDVYREATRIAQVGLIQRQYAKMGIEPPKDLENRFREKPAKVIDDALYQQARQYEDRIEKADEICKQRIEEAANKDEKRKLEETGRARIAEIARLHNEIRSDLESLGPQGVFISFASFELAAIHQLMDAGRRLNFAGRLSEVLGARSTPEMEAASVGTGLGGIGVLPCVALMLRGIQWLVLEHWFFALLLGLVSLAIWSLLGGAICRIAALNVASDERISPKAALSFARRKFFGFFTGPLLPVGMVLAIGFFLFVGGLVGAIPYAGEILVGAGLFLALLGGFVMALVIVGAVAGGSLLWPTIAVEGSDSFDAMSRSYSYVYSKPWRAALYAAVATVYGALTYLFARLFVLILLKATRLFVNLGIVGLGLFGNHRPGTGVAGAKKLDAMWPHPTFENLIPPGAAFGAENWDAGGAFLIQIWLFIVVGLLCAFLVSFYFSGSTVIYYLLRREVDATDLEDVYLEEGEELEEPAPAAAPAAEVGAPAEPAGPPEPSTGAPPPPPAPPEEPQ